MKKLTNEEAKAFLLEWIRNIKENRVNHPEDYREREPGWYVGGVKVQPGDSFAYDNHGFPIINRKGCFE